MKSKQLTMGSMAWKCMQHFVAIAVFVMLLIACSKGDDTGGPIDEPAGTTGNTGNTGGTNQGIGVTVTVTGMLPESPAALKFGEDVEVTYDYNVTRTDGARIWVLPQTNGDNAPKLQYEGSPKFTGKGTKTVKFTVAEGDSLVVDQVKIQIGTGGFNLLGTVFWDPLDDIFELVDYTFTN